MKFDISEASYLKFQRVMFFLILCYLSFFMMKIWTVFTIENEQPIYYTTEPQHSYTISIKEGR